MAKQPQRLRRLRQRRRETTHNLEELYYLIQDIQEDIKDQLEDQKKTEKDKEEKNKPKDNLFTKKFSFGQTLMGVWIASLPLSMFYMWLLWPYIR